jgi:hypothetical protein
MNNFNSAATSAATIWSSKDKWAEGSMGLNDVPPDPNVLLILDPLIITSFALSMAVNAMMTTLIVFKILKVFLEVKSTSGGTRLRPVIFIIIESGMALFAIQLIRVVLSCLHFTPTQSTCLAFNLTIGINQMFNVIINICSFLQVLLMTFTWLGHRTNINFGADNNEIVRR